MGRRLLAGLIAAVALPALSAPPPRPRVAVAIVVDQLAAWVAEERLDHLPKGGGFDRILRKGTWVKRCDYLHALTETAPGHAALYTGRSPRETGIVANDVPRPPAGSSIVSPLLDAGTRLVGRDGPIDGRAGLSLRSLRVDTVADALLRRDPKSIVISISTKDRSAVLGAARAVPGARPPVVLWWDVETAGVVTSTAFAHALPAWVTPPRLPAQFHWEPASGMHRRARVPDDAPGENEALGGRSFPHDFEATGRTFRLTRDADRLTVDLALSAVRAEPPVSNPMLLALSFSRYDYVGHRFGPGSLEAWSALYELDAELARLFDGLDALVGKDAYAVVLSADHGVAPLPEAAKPWCSGAPDPYERPCEPGVRLHSGELTAKLREAGVPVDRVVDSFVYMQDQSPPGAARATLLAEPGVAEVFYVCALDPARSAVERYVFNTVASCEETPRTDAFRASLFIVPKRGSFFAGPTDAASHGSPYAYDRLVPLLVRYAGVRGRSTVAEATYRSFYASLWYALTGEPSNETIGIGRH